MAFVDLPCLCNGSFGNCVAGLIKIGEGVSRGNLGDGVLYFLDDVLMGQKVIGQRHLRLGRSSSMGGSKQAWMALWSDLAKKVVKVLVRKGRIVGWCECGQFS